VEGLRAVVDAPAATATPQLVLFREGVSREVVQTLTAGLSPSAVRFVSETVFNALCDTETPQGVLAVFGMPDPPLVWVVAPIVLIADGVRNPGNFGSLLRSAAAAGVSAVFSSLGTVDVYNGKTVRAAMGAHFRLPFSAITEHHMKVIEMHCQQVLLADVAAVKSYEQFDWTIGTALVVSSEDVGPTEWARSIATDTVRIPLLNNVESLNVAVAGSVMLFEAARQRRAAKI
jgi:TrmH family RNA methyltransferase